MHVNCSIFHFVLNVGDGAKLSVVPYLFTQKDLQVELGTIIL